MRDGRVIVPHPHDLIATAYRVSNPPIPHVLLRPGGAAPVIVSEADGTGYEHPCQSTRTVLVLPPRAGARLSLRLQLASCGRRDMWVLPVGRRN